VKKNSTLFRFLSREEESRQGKKKQSLGQKGKEEGDPGKAHQPKQKKRGKTAKRIPSL